MARKSKILSHPNEPDIKRAIAAREPYRRIASRFEGISEHCVRTYAKKYFPTELAAAREVERVADSGAIIKRLETELDSLRLMREGAEDWLRDPENPERFKLGPRGYDVDVTYMDNSDKECPIKRTDNLQDLIDRLESKHKIGFLHVNVKYKDTAMLLIDAIRSVKPPLELIARVLGVLKDKEEGQGGNTLIVNYVDCRKPWEKEAKRPINER